VQRSTLGIGEVDREPVSNKQRKGHDFFFI